MKNIILKNDIVNKDRYYVENYETDQEIKKIEKKYRRNEPEQFLTMYDAIRDNDKTREQ